LWVADEDSGIRRSQLVNWYLEEIENEIETESDLVERKTVVEKVIYRLIHHVWFPLYISCSDAPNFCTLLNCTTHTVKLQVFRKSFCLLFRACRGPTGLKVGIELIVTYVDIVTGDNFPKSWRYYFKPKASCGYTIFSNDWWHQ